jgi:hypothetical protein
VRVVFAGLEGPFWLRDPLGSNALNINVEILDRRLL